MKLSLGKKIAGAAVAGAVLVGAGSMAWAYGNGNSNGSSTAALAASITSTTPTATAGSAGKGKAGDRVGAVLRRADHGTIEIKAKASTTGTATWQTFTFDRGKVTTVTAGQIVVARPDGQSVTLTINAGTTYRGVTSWQQVATSKGAIVVSANGAATIVAQKASPATGTSGPAAATSPTTAPAA
jgi:hypothetical protein